MVEIGPPELDVRRSSGDDPSALDIRPREAYQRDRIDGSRNVPVYDELRRGGEAELRESLDEIPDDETVVTVRKAGAVARRAASVLEKRATTPRRSPAECAAGTGRSATACGRRSAACFPAEPDSRRYPRTWITDERRKRF